MVSFTTTRTKAQIRLLHSKPTTCSSSSSLLQLRPQGLLPSSTASYRIVVQPLHVADLLQPLLPRARGVLGTYWSSNRCCHHHGHLPLSSPCCALLKNPALWTPRRQVLGPRHGNRYLHDGGLTYKKPYNKCFFCRHLLRPHQLDLLAILDTSSLDATTSTTNWCPFAQLLLPSTPVLHAWLCAVHRSMAPAAACTCYRLAPRGCAFHFQDQSI